jgi:plasmid stabilization system protein ParE
VTPRLVFHLAARADLEEARDWYSAQRSGLGDELGAAVHDMITRIRNYPQLFPEVEPRVRRAVLSRFPYSLLYVIRPEEIEILAVFHHRRDPATWRGRAAV